MSITTSNRKLRILPATYAGSPPTKIPPPSSSPAAPPSPAQALDTASGGARPGLFAWEALAAAADAAAATAAAAA